MLPQIRHAIAGWTETDSHQTGTALKRQVARRIAPYLGPRASARILRGVTPGGENLLTNVEPVLALFLGTRAASRLVDHIVDSVLVRS